ncbi:MAG: aspartate aminotransferase family protein [Salinirussus sp.]
MSYPTRDSATGAALPHWHDPSSRALEIVSGDGVRVTDADGTEHLDFISQLYCVNAGHGNEAIIRAMQDQLGDIQYVSPAKHNDARTTLANRLTEIAPNELSAVFFSISGSEANESAVQLAREYTGRPKVLTRWRSYHGSTTGAGALTGDPETRAPLEQYGGAPGTGKFLPPLPGAFDTADPQELADRAVDHLRYVIRNEGPTSIAAILMEPIGGTSGAYPPPADYLSRVRSLCRDHDILFIADEVITGFGRCGDWFGVDTEDIQPDLLTFAKAVTSAYSPLAGVLVRDDIAEQFRAEGYPLGQTFSGHPVACAAGVAALEEYAGGLIENARDLHNIFAEELDKLADAHDVIHDVRGRGFLWGVEFADPSSGDPIVDPRTSDAANPVMDVIDAAADRGTIIGRGRPPTQVLLAPPLTADAATIKEGLTTLDDAIDVTF